METPTEDDPMNRPVLITRPVSHEAPGTTWKDHILKWDEYFMSVALLSGGRSKDSHTQVGACIVNKEKRIIGTGYNGMPDGIDDATAPWARESASGNPLETKKPYVCHAEMNAILNRFAADSRGCTLYTSLFPCNECAKLILQAGISEVVYLSDKKHMSAEVVAAKAMFNHAKKNSERENVVYEKTVQPDGSQTTIVRQIETALEQKVRYRQFEPDQARMMVHIDFDHSKV